jgi:NOL1/NOP2/fmu family ribosome biogenesis protein
VPVFGAVIGGIMQRMTFLNTREHKRIIDELEKLYGFSGKLDGVLIKNLNQKLYLLTRQLDLIDLKEEKELRIDKAGLYIGAVVPDGIRLSLEGCQLVGPYAKKNVLAIDDAHLEPWAKGEDLDLSPGEIEQVAKEGYHLIKHGKDFLGCAKIRNGAAHNLVSKSRRLKVLNH